MKHVVCYSGGHSSAKVAIEVVKRYGRENTILLNHDISGTYEDSDIKRFKLEVAAYLQLPIIYANYNGIENPEDLPSQFEVCIEAGGIKQPGTGTALCTHRLKTLPFERYLAANFPAKDAIVYYGFDDDEQERINRRTFILEQMGYTTAFPLAHWPDTIESTEEIGITPPLTYANYKHANCVGCLKAGIQHWYVVFCTRPDVFIEAMQMECLLGYAILADQSVRPRRPMPLKELAPIFALMEEAGVPATEHLPGGKFRVYLKRFKLEHIQDKKPCECLF